MLHMSGSDRARNEAGRTVTKSISFTPQNLVRFKTLQNAHRPKKIGMLMSVAGVSALVRRGAEDTHRKSGSPTR